MWPFLGFNYFNQNIYPTNPLQELDLYDILSFDAELGKILQELHLLVCRKHYLESTGSDSRDEITDLRFRGASIEDLYFDFSLPGYPDYILKPGDETVWIHILTLISP